MSAVQDSVDLPQTIKITNDGRSWYVGADPAFAESITALLQAVSENVTPAAA